MASQFGSYDFGAAYAKSSFGVSTYRTPTPNSGQRPGGPSGAGQSPSTGVDCMYGPGYFYGTTCTSRFNAQSRTYTTLTSQGPIIFVACLWFVFIPVTLYYLARRRAKLDYGFFLGLVLCTSHTLTQCNLLPTSRGR